MAWRLRKEQARKEKKAFENAIPECLTEEEYPQMMGAV
jgi:hypothetical protein